MGFCSLYFVARLPARAARRAARVLPQGTTGPSDRRQAAVDGYDGSGEERSFVRCEVQAQQEDRAQVHLDNPVELLHRGLEERLSHHDAVVIVEDVDPPEPLARL